MSISTIDQTTPSIVLNNKLTSHYAEIQSEQVATPRNSAPSNQDKLTLSAEAQAATEAGIPPELFAMRLPDWYADTISPAKMYNSGAVHETGKLFKLYETAQADGRITTQEQKAIDSYRDNMVANKAMRAQHNFQISHGNELAEYAQIKEDTLTEVINSLGIDRQTAMTADYQHSDEVGRRFNALLADNPRAAELMEMLGVGDKNFFYPK